MQFDADETRPGTGGAVSLYANGERIGEGRIDRTVPIAFSSYAGMDIGRDNGLVVDPAYKTRAPYAFTGTVRKVVFDLKPVRLEDEMALHEHGAAQAVGAGAGG
jgi:arylsulfatase